MDVRADDAAGRGALRQCLELFAAADDRPRPDQRPDVPRHAADASSETEGVNFKDVSPRGGLALDVFGNGKTAVKINVGKYMDPASNLNGNYSISNPIARIATTAARTWTDNGTGGPGTPGYGDFIPQCDLTNNAANGECLATTATTFGTQTANHRRDRPGAAERVGRASEGLAVRRVGSAAAAAARLGRGRLSEALAPELHRHRQPGRRAGDFTPFSITAPSDSRLPDGGGYPVDGLYNVVPGEVRADQQQHHAHRASSTRASTACCSTSARESSNGLTLQGGINAGKQVTDYCDLRAICRSCRSASPEPSEPDQSVLPGRSGVDHEDVRRRLVHVPKIDVLFAGTLRSDQGAPLRAN